MAQQKIIDAMAKVLSNFHWTLIFRTALLYRRDIGFARVPYRMSNLFFLFFERMFKTGEELEPENWKDIFIAAITFPKWQDIYNSGGQRQKWFLEAKLLNENDNFARTRRAAMSGDQWKEILMHLIRYPQN